MAIFLTLDLFLDQLDFQINKISWIFWKKKKIIEKIEYSRSLSDPENYWCGHQQPYNFFPISEHLQITQENQNQLIQSEKIAVTGGKKFLDYLKRKDFYNQLKKIFISLITGEPVYV